METTRKTMVIVPLVVVLATVGMGTVLDAYGIVSGTVEVTAAASLSVDASSDEITLTKNINRNIKASDNMNVTSSSQGDVASDIEMSSDTKVLSSTISAGDTVKLWINGNLVEEVTA